MADDGYLVGFEDSNGNFVEVGRLNNTAEDVTKPFEIKHADSGNTVELGPNGFNLVNVDLDLSGNNISNVSDLDVSTVVQDYIYAGGFDGADPNARLDNAITSASGGDVIYLENAIYDSNQTISNEIWFVGAGTRAGVGTQISADWTHNGSESGIERVNMATGSLTIGGNSFIATKIRRGSITFQSGTSNGIIDTCSGTAVTDNGTNTVGDIA